MPEPSPSAGAPAATAIVAAMPEEMEPLRSRTKGAVRVARMGAGRFEIVTARLDGRPVVLAVTGDGARNAREGIAAVLAAVPVECLIAIGVAGALSGDLGAGTLVVSERVICGGSDTALHADGSLVDMAERHAGARRGVVVTAGRIVDTVSERERLLRVAAPGSAVAVVDLESAAYADAAARASIPWIVLRGVSDTANEALPDLLNRCRDDGGAVRRGRVALELLRDPSALPTLLFLRQRVKQCAEVLARATEAILAASSRSRPVPPPHNRPASRGGI